MRSPRQWVSAFRQEAGLRETLARVSASERRFRELADTAPVLIWTCNASGLVDFVNRGWLEFTGRSEREELGDSWTVGVHPDDAGAVRATWWQSFEEREPWEREYRLKTRDGTYRWIVDRGVPRYVNGKFAGFVGTATDIDERKQAEERLANAYSQEHEVAVTLQHSLLPDRLPEFPEVTLAARYLPAASGSALGGDWYDAIELDGQRLAVVVGDVVGHGLRAAATMSQLRSACRAYALLDTSPAETFGHLDRLLAAEGKQTMATAFYAVVDRDTGRVEYSSAGHPPALVVGKSGSRFLDDGRSVPIGTSGRPRAYTTAEDRLEPGDTLILYTDGLVERRDVLLDDSLAEMAEIAERAEGDVEQVCDTILARLEPDGIADDVAVLALRLTPAARNLDLTLPADPAVLGDLRRQLGRLLDTAGASAQERYEITLAVCEAAANAIEHAYGPADAEFEVKARLDGRQVQATVRDRGTWRDRDWVDAEGTRGRGLGIIEGLMDNVEVSRSDAGTTVGMSRRLEPSETAR